MPARSFIHFAEDVEEVAAGLHSFGDRLPRHTAHISAIISQLFGLSSTLREIDNAEGDFLYASSAAFDQVQEDFDLLFPSLRRTLQDVRDMFASSRELSYQRAWDDLAYMMERNEGWGLLERCEVFRAFLRAQADILDRRRPSQRLDEWREEIITLWDAQRLSGLRVGRLSIEGSASSTPRPRPARPRPARLEMPILPLSPISSSEAWSDNADRGMWSPAPPWAPDPPPLSPISPTYTSGPTRTFDSSQTSYSSDSGALPLVHWAQDVFDGQNPGTPFAAECQLTERSRCHGRADASSLEHLRRDGFVLAVELPFDRDEFWVRLYYRPSDSRSRILLITKDNRGRELLYCAKLINLKIVRDASSLQLCRARGDRKYDLWARLNFHLYERMVLFYCTFTAMKRQDTAPLPHPDLLDDDELAGPNADSDATEVQEYGGVVRHRHLLHALRLYRDQASDVVRLEASAFRGPMQNVPLWTAFLTRYAHDSDHVHFEGAGTATVSFAALRPPPYVFLAGYRPPRNERGEYVLRFDSDRDAREFVETWSGLCRNYR